MKNLVAYQTGLRKIELREEEIAGPGPDEVQVQCLANGICAGDIFLFGHNGGGRDYSPQRIGHEGVGVVTARGANVSSVKEGDFVQCFHWAKYSNIPLPKLVRFRQKPGVPVEALIEPPSCAVSAYHEYHIEPGDRALVIGAGYMGLLNVQLLANSPLSELVVCDLKKRNLELAAEFGATETVELGSEDGNQKLEEYKKKPFDLVIECAGSDPALQTASELVKVGVCLAIFSWHHAPRALDIGRWHLLGLRVANASPMIAARRNFPAYERTAWLLESGVFNQQKLITHRFHIEDVQKAMEQTLTRDDSFIKGAFLFS